MSDYNQYARRLDSAFNSASVKQREALKEYDTAAAQAKAAVTPEEKKRAAETMQEAKKKLDEVQRNTWKEFRNIRDQIGKELDEAVRKAEAVNGDDVDNGAISLLNSNMLTVNDLKEMSERYQGNNTMSRLIGNKAAEMAREEKDYSARQELSLISHRCGQTEGSKAQQQWDALCDVSRHYSGELQERPDPGYIANVSMHWQDDDVQSVIDNF